MLRVRSESVLNLAWEIARGLFRALTDVWCLAERLEGVKAHAVISQAPVIPNLLVSVDDGIVHVKRLKSSRQNDTTCDMLA